MSDIQWRLDIEAIADTRPGTPEEIELSKRRAAVVEKQGKQALDPDPPALDPKCADCYEWREYRSIPDTYAWFAICSFVGCGCKCHDGDL